MATSAEYEREARLAGGGGSPVAEVVAVCPPKIRCRHHSAKPPASPPHHERGSRCEAQRASLFCRGEWIWVRTRERCEKRRNDEKHFSTC